jgi:two-component system, NtrC family, sensor kinase
MEKTLIETEKLAGIGTLAAGMAHEINTPLQVVAGTTEGLLNRLKEGQELSHNDLERRLDRISQNAWRISEIVRSILYYARGSTGQVRLNSLNEIVKDTLRLVEHQFKDDSKIDIIKRLEADLPQVECDGGKISQVLVNLLNNARDSMPLGGRLTIQSSYDAQANELVLRVSDTGTGIPEEIRDKIFDPFFTTKPPGKGTGLGLSVSAGILRAHHGRLELESSSAEGSVFKISLPLSVELAKEENNHLGRYRDNSI